MSRCIRTLTYILSGGSLITFRMASMIETTISGFFARAYWHHFEWTTLASIAVAKSRQNMCILVYKLFLTRLSTQLIISFSQKALIKLSFTEHFCRIARQNL